MKKKAPQKKKKPAAKKAPQKKPEGYVFGRPSLYQGALTIKKVEDYILECKDEEVQFVKQVTAKGKKIYETRLQVRIPMVDGLALHLGIARPTIYDWAEKYPDFSYVLEQMMALQAKRLGEGGLSGTYNAPISKLLMHKHGYVDESKSENKNRTEHSLSALYDATEKD